MTFDTFQQLPTSQRHDELFKCCGSSAWVKKLNACIPFSSVEQLKSMSDEIWNACGTSDWLEAFTHHPEIGDINSLAKKFASTQQWASGEQSGVNTATSDVLVALAAGNKAYKEKFGFIFIVCATGKTADEMLALLQQRLVNSPEMEIKIAAQEQNKITHIRIDKLLS